MSNQPFTAYRLGVTEPDGGMPNGVLQMDYIAIKQSAEEAIRAVEKKRRKQAVVEVIASGDEVMAHAKRLNLRDGDESEL